MRSKALKRQGAARHRRMAHATAICIAVACVFGCSGGSPYDLVDVSGKVTYDDGSLIPAGSIMDLASARDITLMDLSDSLEGMKKLNPGYTLVTVPKGTYPKQDKDVKVIGYATHIVASCKLPEDMVYAMTKAMAANVSNMAAVNKAMTGLTPKAMAEDIGVPFHPGAAKFYKEAGVQLKM